MNKFDLKSTIGFDTTKLAKNSDVDISDIDKLVTVAIDLAKLCYVV